MAKEAEGRLYKSSLFCLYIVCYLSTMKDADGIPMATDGEIEETNRTANHRVRRMLVWGRAGEGGRGGGEEGGEEQDGELVAADEELRLVAARADFRFSSLLCII